MSLPPWSQADVPRECGVYLFRDASGAVLYVGKARNLRRRLQSYRKSGGDGRLLIRFLERQARSLETIVTRTEAEAVLLEAQLVKQHRPAHNIRLKDDKSFLMIRLDPQESFPRLKLVRAHSPKRDKKSGPAQGRSRLFGPYASSRAVRATLADLHRVVPLRDCPDAVFAARTRPCLKHQLGLCSAPCVGLIKAPDYAVLVDKAARILGGDAGELERELAARMEAAAAAEQFERAAAWRDRLAALRRTLERQGVRARAGLDRDVLALARSGSQAALAQLCWRGGQLLETHCRTFVSELPSVELWHGLISALYAQGAAAAPAEILVEQLPAERELLQQALGQGVHIRVPGSGEGLRMLALARANARSALERRERTGEQGRSAGAALAELLGLPSPAEVVDGFDVSNFQGAHGVASRVRFRGGFPDKSGYRRFKLRTVPGQDDFAALREVVARALRRDLEQDDLPDLVLIDGGAGQLAAALAGRDEAGAFDVPLVALAKARPARKRAGVRLQASQERLFLPNEREPRALERHSALCHFVQRVRDEAHRFAITYHRKERGRLPSVLDGVAGLGPKKKRALLVRFGSLAGVRAASQEELAALPGIGAALAARLRERLARNLAQPGGSSRPS
jgi:excinuclease ABC subunit C